MKINWNVLARTGLVIGLAFAAIGPAWADTPVSGTIATSRSWTLAQSPYVVTSDVDITSGAVLTIEAGVSVRFQEDANLGVVQGALVAVGTAANRIVFTSDNDKAGSVIPAAAGDWGRVRIGNDAVDATTRIAYADLRYGHGLQIQSASPSIDNVHFQHNAGAAIELDLASSPHGRGLQASGNQVNGIRVPAGAITGSVSWGLTGIPYVLASGDLAIGVGPPVLSPATQRIAPHSSGSLQVDLGDVAPPGGTQLTLSSSQPSVAHVVAAVTVPEGVSSINVAVNTGVVGSAVISASRAGAVPGTATIVVAHPVTLSLSPATPNVSVDHPLTMRVTASEPIAEGLTVTLLAGDPTLFSVPVSVAIAPNESSVDFVLQGLQTGQSTLTASAAGIASVVVPVAVTTQSLAWPSWPTTTVVAPDATLNVPLTLSEPAPAGGLVIALESSSAHVSVPATVTVPAGVDTIDVAITGVSLGDATVTASASGYGSSGRYVVVETIAILFDMSQFDQQPQSDISPAIPLGLYDEYTIVLSSEAPAGGIVIDFTMTDGSVVSLNTTTISIPAGERIASVPIRFTSVLPGNVEITAHAEGLIDAHATVTVGESRPTLRWSDSETVLVGHSLQKMVYLERLLDGESFRWHLPHEVTLSNSDAAALGVPTTIIFPSYHSYLEIPLTGLAPSSAPISIAATSAFYTPPETQLNASVVTPTLNFAVLEALLSVGTRRDDFYLSWSVGPDEGQTAVGDQVVQLEIVDESAPGIVPGIYSSPTNATEIDSLEIPAGSATSTSAFVGSPTVNGSYSIRGTLAGVGSWTASTTVTEPELRWTIMHAQVGHGLGAYAHVYRVSADGETLAAPEDVTITLQSSDPGKVSVPATVTILAGATDTRVFIAGVALTTEPVVIHASAPGHTAPPSPLGATVITPTLEFSPNFAQQAIGSTRNIVWLGWKAGGETQYAATDQNVQLEIVDATPAGIVDGLYNADPGGSQITSVTIFRESNTPSVPFYIGSPTVPGSYAIRATVPGIGSWTMAPINVVGVELRWFRSEMIIGHRLTASSLYLSRMNAGGETVARTAVPLQIALSCADGTVCSVPATVTMPAGAYNVSIPITGTGVGTTTLTPTAAHHEAEALDIESRTATFRLTSVPSSLRLGTQGSHRVVYAVPGTETEFYNVSPLTVAMSTGAPAVLSVPASIGISANGYASGFFNSQANGLGATSITVSAPGFTPYTSPQITVTQ